METRTRWATTLPLLIGLVLAGCEFGPKSGRGFRLPDGDAAKGQEIFVSRQCTSCHTLKGIDLPAPTTVSRKMVELGGPVSRLRTYGELVTSIVNPSHRLASKHDRADVSRDGESLMRNYNSILTVQELIDLVAFLQPRYKITTPRGSTYPVYAP